MTDLPREPTPEDTMIDLRKCLFNSRRAGREHRHRMSVIAWAMDHPTETISVIAASEESAKRYRGRTPSLPTNVQVIVARKAGGHDDE